MKFASSLTSFFHWLAASLLGASSAISLWAAEPRTVPWDLTALAHAPKTYPATATAEGVRGLYFEGLPWKGKPTRVFAWYGVPKTAAGAKVPAVVLLHGGGGTAFDEWVRIWNSHGYAAISLALEGQDAGGDRMPYPRHAFSGPERAGIYEDIELPVADQWYFHAMADAILANSLLRSFPEIDASRIGVTGISWGGIMTTGIVGVDPRFAFAIPVYGCGFLSEVPRLKAALEKSGHTARYLELWEPVNFLGRATLPMLWVNDANDLSFPLNVHAKTTALPRGPSTISLHVGMRHGHKPGWSRPEIYVFADSVTKGGEPLARIEEEGRDRTHAWLRYRSGHAVKKAELVYTTEPKDWVQAVWQIQPARLDETAKRATAELPPGTRGYFFNVIDDRDLLVSTAMRQVAAGEGSRP